VAPAFSLSSPNEERAGVRSLKEHGEMFFSISGGFIVRWRSGLMGKGFNRAGRITKGPLINTLLRCRAEASCEDGSRVLGPIKDRNGFNRF
jgi:hypothetical protein